MNTCDYCQKPFEPTRSKQRFCSSACRSSWHHENEQHGLISGIHAIKRGWSITMQFSQIPEGFAKGAAIKVKDGSIKRLDAS